MKRLCGIVLLCLLVSPAAAADKPAPRGSLEAYARKTQGRQAYGVYVKDPKSGKDVKLGWMISETKVVRRDGKDVLLSAEDFVFEVHREGQKTRQEIKSLTYFSLQGNGEVLSIEETKKQDGRQTTTRAAAKGGKFVITTEVNGRKDERTVALPKKTFLSARQLDDWLQSTPRKGATFESWSVELDLAEVDVKDVYTFLDRKKLTWGGVPVDVFHVTLVSRGVKQDVDMKSDGTILKASFGGMQLRAEPEALARKLDSKVVNFLALTSISVDKDLGDPTKVESLTLEVLGLADYSLPTSHRQQVRNIQETVILDLRRDFRIEKPAPLTKEQRAKYLMATHTIQSNKDKVKKLARKIAGDEKEPLKVARKLKTWVYRKLRKSMKANAPTTLEVLDNMAGDCTEHTLLFVSLARAAGVPAREVSGVAFADSDGAPFFGWHAWAEIHDGSQWVTVDPTWNEFYVDATHVKFAEGEDPSWLNVLGKVKFKVLKFKKK